ncbi:hypothetical protein GCM10010911_07320 [Paenibacillus nasutitermitis]|uniref:Uncharacterized protein n=1 Tax=Paenibacillus nasutitermitis TaxID=1652958 RepID=A0A917DNU9_9BACL|nr:hypothetical protein GCM10010911_07320 [Paenibacillus nasutitermitis]
MIFCGDYVILVKEDIIDLSTCDYRNNFGDELRSDFLIQTINKDPNKKVYLNHK